MKKVFKNNIKIILAVIIAIVITGGISVYATASILANDVGYTKQGTDVTNVAEALNDLYSKIGNKIIFSGTVGYEVYGGTFYYDFNSNDVNSNYIKSSTEDTTVDNNSLTVSLTMNKACDIRVSVDGAHRGVQPSVIGEVKKNGTAVSNLSTISVNENDVITIYFNNTKTGNGNEGGGGYSIIVEKIDNKADLKFITGINDRNTGVEQITIDRDCDNAMIITGQVSLEYAINQTDSFSGVTAYGDNQNGMGLYYADNISLKKGDIVYLRRGTYLSFGYAIIY